MSSSETFEHPATGSVACGQCRTPMADDQRYCLGCGARRGPVPPAVASVIGALAGARSADAGPDDVSGAEGERMGPLALLASLSPRAAAVAVMSTLAFGVVVGSGASSLANSGAPVLLAVSPQRAAVPLPAAPVNSSPSSGGSPSSAPASSPSPTTVTQTVTAQTVTQAAASGGGGSSGTPASTGPTLPPVKHVFLIMLSNEGYQQTFGSQSHFPYLAHTLRRQGELLANYYAVAQSPLANAVAMISGQGPTAQTVADCPVFTDITPGTRGSEGQVHGSGCVYPTSTQTLPDQLTANGDTWKAYIEGINDGPPGTATTCRHPVVGAQDADQAPRAGDPYVTWRNPFVYFLSLAQGTGCVKQDVGLQELIPDLASSTSTPSFSYIVPSPCDDGDEQPCVPGQPVNTAAAEAATDSFLHSIVPRIEQSPAYKDGGLIAITSDEAPQTGPQADQSACCNIPTYPNLSAAAPGTGTSTTSATTTTAPATTTTSPATTTTSTTPTPTGTTTTTSPTTTSATTTTTPAIGGETTPTGGGGQVGLLLISSYVKPNSSDSTDYYDHYSLLSSIESLFSLTHLGYATDPQLPVFDQVTYNAYKG